MQYVLIVIYVNAFVGLLSGLISATFAKDRRAQIGGIGLLLIGIAMLLVGILSVLTDIAQAL